MTSKKPRSKKRILKLVGLISLTTVFTFGLIFSSEVQAIAKNRYEKLR